MVENGKAVAAHVNTCAARMSARTRQVDATDANAHVPQCTKAVAARSTRYNPFFGGYTT